MNTTEQIIEELTARFPQARITQQSDRVLLAFENGIIVVQYGDTILTPTGPIKIELDSTLLLECISYRQIANTSVSLARIQGGKYLIHKADLAKYVNRLFMDLNNS